MERKDLFVLVVGMIVLTPMFFAFISDSFYLYVFGIVYGIFNMILFQASTIIKNFWRKYAEANEKIWDKLESTKTL